MVTVHSLTDDEWSAFEDVSKENWGCDHGRLFTEDCDACDLEWYAKDNETVIEYEPDKCDHGIDMLGPGYGKCAECDKVCYNTDKMGVAACWRMADGKKWRFNSIDNEWVEAAPGYSGWQQGTYSSSKKCKHFMQAFELEDGLVIHASAERDAPYHDKREEQDYPDVGIYLYSGWVRGAFSATSGLDVPWATKAYWPMAWLDWPDYSVPSFDDVVKLVPWVMERIQAGSRVETGCLGGHGRTGTLLALLLVQQGVKPGTAMNRVWDKYCIEAIESAKQVDLVIDYYEHLHGKKWRQSKAERALVKECIAVFEPKVKTQAKSAPVNLGKGTTTKGVTQPSTNIEKAKVCTHYKPLDEPCVPCDYKGWQY